MASLREVNSREDLKKLVTHLILAKKTPFSDKEIVEEVMKHSLFNHFCKKRAVWEIVIATRLALQKANHILACSSARYIPD